MGAVQERGICSGPRSGRTTRKDVGRKLCPTARRLGSSHETPPIRVRLLAVGRLRAARSPSSRRSMPGGSSRPPLIEIEVRQRLPTAALKAREAQLIS
jgi:hypothetical protein